MVEDKQLIKIVTGIRRCGKSTLLELYQEWLKKQGIEEEQIISLNFENLDYEELTDYKKLYAYLKERLIKNKMTYIFLDEVHHIDNLSGRYVQIGMLPLSFKEYMESTGNMNDRGIKYTEYLQNSSFPYTLELKGHPEEIRDYLEGIYNTIVVKDIVNRKKITDTMMLKSVLRFVFDNIGNPLSSKRIADTMTSNGRKIDTKTVEKYLESLSESYIIYQAKRYDIKSKQYLKTLEKYYIVDIGLRFMLLGFGQADAGRILENIVYLELLRRGYDVYVGKVNAFEVDFVARNSRGITYFQVALSVRDEKTLERELIPLQAIRDHYPKFILTMDDDPEDQYDGIRRVLEGVATSFPQTEDIIENGQVNGVSATDVQKILNLKHAWEFILDRDVIQSESNYHMLCHIAKLVNEGFFYDGGRIRGIPVQIGGTSYVPPLPIESVVVERIDEIRKQDKEPIEIAIELCMYCMKTQVFKDGNKRASVIFSNHFLISKGMGLLVIPEKDVTKFKKLLIEYYEGAPLETIGKFLREKCWKNF